jgi:hypothetical protein
MRAIFAVCCGFVLVLGWGVTPVHMQSTTEDSPSLTAVLSLTLTPAVGVETPAAGTPSSPAASETPTDTDTPVPTAAAPAETPTEQVVTVGLPPPPPAPTDTATPRPSPTNNAGPSASSLLARMRSAVFAARSVHLSDVDLSEPVKNTTVTTKTTGDLVWSGNRLHETTTVVRRQGTSHGVTPINQGYQLEIVGQKAAWRPERMSWNCERLINVKVIDTLLARKAALVEPHIRSTVRISGQIVYHVRALGSILTSGGATRPTIDFYFAEKTFIPVRTVSSTPSSQGLRPETVTETYSHWGERPHISLPGKCG